MWKILLSLELLIILASEAVKQPIKVDGGWFFRGRGCGVSTKYKYLTRMPDPEPEEDPADLDCTFVYPKDKIEKGFGGKST